MQVTEIAHSVEYADAITDVIRILLILECLYIIILTCTLILWVWIPCDFMRSIHLSVCLSVCLSVRPDVCDISVKHNS